MRLIETTVDRSPRDPASIRLEAAIGLDGKSRPLRFWFDMPSELGDRLSPSGNGWLILMLPIACVLREDIVMDRPVDRLLVDNLNGLQMLWQAWYPAIKPIRIHAEGGIANGTTDHSAGRTISCFSGGVDSLFSFFQHDMRITGASQPAIHDLFNLGGFNTTMEDFAKMRRDLGPVADDLGCQFVPILTNVRYSDQGVETAYSNPHWMDYLSHGALLASVIHLLGRRYDRLIVPSGKSYRDLVPWGSHPLADPLLSSSDLAIVHDSCSFTRIDKTALIAKFPDALDALHVCWQDRRIGNCSKCSKCLRTMTTLDLIGAKDQAKTFDWSGNSMAKLGQVWLQDSSGLAYFVEIADRARQLGRDDVADAVESSVRFSKRKQAALGLINSNPISRNAWQTVRPIRDAIRSSLRR
jgi:hypothetical protein